MATNHHQDLSSEGGADEVQNKFAVYLAERRGYDIPSPVLRKFDIYLMHLPRTFSFVNGRATMVMRGDGFVCLLVLSAVFFLD